MAELLADRYWCVLYDRRGAGRSRLDAPITQAYLIKEHIPQTRITFINECGHIPWLDQPQAFRESISAFIDSADAPSTA
jgi:pimeloyl-ACP methyl ester carboxylesterase